MEKSAMVNGINTELKKIMDSAKLVLKMISIDNKESKKIIIPICYLIVMDLANKKAYKSKRLNTVKLDIAKSVLIS